MQKIPIRLIHEKPARRREDVIEELRYHAHPDHFHDIASKWKTEDIEALLEHYKDPQTRYIPTRTFFDDDKEISCVGEMLARVIFTHPIMIRSGECKKVQVGVDWGLGGRLNGIDVEIKKRT